MLASVSSLLHDFRCHVGRSPAVGSELLVFVVSEAEVDELDVPLVIDQHVGHLEVAVVDASVVQVLHGGEQLGENEECFLFGELLRVLHPAVLAERGGAAHLHNEEYLCERTVLSSCLR